jgi:hypothetical protein
MARRSRSGPAPRLSPYVVASLAAVFMLSLAAVSAIPASALPVTPGPAAVDREPPAKWDGRVADLADFVERKRGLTRGDTACVRVAFTGEDARATEQIAASLDQWVAAGPAGAASVERTDGAATLTACDPGQAADDEKVNAAGDVLDARSYALSGSMTDGAPIEAAECVADRASVEPDLRAFLVSVDEPPQDQIDAFLDKIAGVERACAA